MPGVSRRRPQGLLVGEGESPCATQVSFNRAVTHCAIPGSPILTTIALAMSYWMFRCSARPFASNSSSKRYLNMRRMEDEMARGFLLWMLGVPLSVIVLIALFTNYI